MCRNMYCSTIPYIKKWGKVCYTSKGEFVYMLITSTVCFYQIEICKTYQGFFTLLPSKLRQNFKLALFFLDKRVVIFNIYHHFTRLLKLCIA